jgi:hypothetical protein
MNSHIQTFTAETFFEKTGVWFTSLASIGSQKARF